AYPLIQLAFGSQWDAAVPLMRWLCGAAIIGTLIYQVNGLLTAVGRYREVTNIEVQYQLVRVGLAVLAAFYSLEAVAASQILVYVVAVFLYYRKLCRYDALRVRALVAALAPSAALTVATSIPPAAVLVLWPGPPSHHYVGRSLSRQRAPAPRGLPEFSCSSIPCPSKSGTGCRCFVSAWGSRRSQVEMAGGISNAVRKGWYARLERGISDNGVVFVIRTS